MVIPIETKQDSLVEARRGEWVAIRRVGRGRGRFDIPEISI